METVLLLREVGIFRSLFFNGNVLLLQTNAQESSQGKQSPLAIFIFFLQIGERSKDLKEGIIVTKIVPTILGSMQ